MRRYAYGALALLAALSCVALCVCALHRARPFEPLEVDDSDDE
eukprot:CAMPEP_0179299800 /NCGR_PEP_ID=MMETSP0797-20121207/46703_1 /TAXON_ID=47934 /ORGANISM="Dinophysis acuminata, Strain DAEP01" /LENGTH=42 /DNA_ID= /DNA_START= /DNA_END= /DNA_ORIENTATION=